MEIKIIKLKVKKILEEHLHKEKTIIKQKQQLNHRQKLVKIGIKRQEIFHQIII